MITFFFERLKDSTSFGMGTNELELRFEEQASCRIDLMLDVFRSSRPIVVVLEDVVDSEKKAGSKTYNC